MNIIKKLTLLTNVFIIIFCFLGATSKSASELQSRINTKLYENKTFDISLKYNPEWKKNPSYTEKYEGKDGFFQISAYSGETLKIDELAQNEANHPQKPYGSNPKITKLTIQGQEARLIMPSDDQIKEFNNQAELIVRYPKEIKINSTTYYYFILWADKNNIHKISDTLRFL